MPPSTTQEAPVRMQTKVPSRLMAITRGQSSYEVSTRSDPAAGAGVVDKHVESAAPPERSAT